MRAILPVPCLGASAQRESGKFGTQDLRLGPRACLRQEGDLRILASDIVLVHGGMVVLRNPASDLVLVYISIIYLLILFVVPPGSLTAEGLAHACHPACSVPGG